jgi:hypothetical protein
MSQGGPRCRQKRERANKEMKLRPGGGKAGAEASQLISRCWADHKKEKEHGRSKAYCHLPITTRREHV